MLIANKIEDLDEGRKGMGKVLFTVIDYIVQRLPPNSKLPELSENDKKFFE